MIQFKMKVRDCHRGQLFRPSWWARQVLGPRNSTRLGLRFLVNLYPNFKLMDDV